MRGKFILLGLGVLATAAAKLTPNQEKVDYGHLHETDGVQSARIWFVNRDTVENQITRVRTTCGCTVAQYDDQMLAPGDSAWIDVTYDPSGRLGKFEKAVKVTDLYKQTVTIPVTGVIIGLPETIKALYPVEAGPLNLSTDDIMMRPLSFGESKHVFVDAYNSSDKEVVPLLVTDSEAVEIMHKVKPIEPGAIEAFAFYIKSKNAQSGNNTFEVRLYPNESDTTTYYPIKINVNIEGGASTAPTEL